MNWTGGSLQRMRKSNGGVVQQQKAYFARARIHLQNVTHSPAAPFRPSYLYAHGNDDSHVSRQGGRPDLRAPYGDSQREHNEEEIPKKARVSFRARRECKSTMEDAKGAKGIVGGMSRLKRSITDADPECQLLEANRKRLLKRPDWIGVKPSKPVNLPVMPSRDKHRIGKRRKTEVEPGGATARRRVTSNFVHRPIQDDVPIKGLQSGLRRDDVDHMRIRIGTDALTSAYSTQRHGRGQSQDSSDPMLFEQTPNAGTAQHLDVVQPVSHWPDAASSAFRQEHTAPVPSLADDHHRRDSDTARNMANSPSPDDPRQHNSEDGQIEAQVSHVHTLPPRKRQRSEASAAGHCMTDRAPNSHEDDDGHKHTGDDCFGYSAKGQLHIDVAMLGDAAQSRGTRQAERDADDCPNGEEPSAARTIVDVKAWESFLAIANGDSSHSATATESRNSNMRLHPTARNNNKAVATWSQLATQGDQTQTSSSAISASLPCIKRGIGRRALTDESMPGRDSIDVPTRKQFQNLREDEKLWQAFVFGSDNAPSWQPWQERGYQGALSNEMEATSCVWLSAAVSPLHSTWSNVSPRRVGCMEDNVQAANVRPQSEARKPTRSPPVVQEHLEEVGDVEGEVSRSWLDRACCETRLEAAKTHSGTRTVGRRLQHARSRSWTQDSCMQARLGSDGSDNLHLVEPETEA